MNTPRDTAARILAQLAHMPKTFVEGVRGGRFERDESGWPTLAAVSSGWPAKDRDGLPLVSGETMYCRRRGRLFRGTARPGPNDNWSLISHGRAIHVQARDLFRCVDASVEPRRLVPGQLGRVRVELEKALKANKYGRVETLARVSRMIEATHTKGAAK